MDQQIDLINQCRLELLEQWGDRTEYESRIRLEILRYAESMVRSGDLRSHILRWIERPGYNKINTTGELTDAPNNMADR